MRAHALAVLSVFALPVFAQETRWNTESWDAALAAAKDAKAGLVLVYLWRDKDDDCAAFYQDTIVDKSVVQAMADFVCVSAKKEDPQGEKLHQRFHVERVPCVLLVKPDGTVEDVLLGVLSVAQFNAELVRVRSGKGTIGAVRAEAAARPADLALQWQLARKLRFSGDREGSTKVVDAMLAKDPKFQSEPAAEAKLERICENIFKPETEPKAVDLKELKEFTISQKSKRILFLCWDKMAAAEWRREDIKAAAAACAQAFKNAPNDEAMDWGNRVVARAYEFRKDLDPGQQKLLLDIAKKAITLAEEAAKTRSDGKQFLAARLYTFATAQYICNLRKEAFATMDRAIAMDPANENLKKALEAWKSGVK